MSDRFVAKKLAQAPSEGLSLSEHKESKRKDKHKKESPESKLGFESNYFDDDDSLNKESETDDDSSFLSHEFECDAHSSYRVIDLDVKQDEGELKEEKVKIKFKQAHEQSFFSNWFNQLTHVKWLCVEAVSIDSHFFSALKKFIDDNSSLQYLHVRVQKIQEKEHGILDSYLPDALKACSLKDVFDSYSSLEEVTVEVRDDHYGANRNYKPLIERNKRVRVLVAEAKAYISAIPVPVQKTRKVSKKNEEEFLIKLAPIYEKAWQVCDRVFLTLKVFLRLVAGENRSLFDQLERARNFHPLVVARDGKLKKLKEIFIIREGELDVNQVYVEDYTPCRLIDVTKNNELIQYLVNEQKANATSFEEYESMQRRLRSSGIRSPFQWHSDQPEIETSNLVLKVVAGFYGAEKPIDVEFLDSCIDIVYDALACAIVNREDEVFKNVLNRYCSDIEVAINKPLQQGIFIGFTLFQLVCLNFRNLHKGHILLFIQNKLEQSSSAERQSLLDSRFPAQKKYEHESGLTVWQYLTYHLHIEFLLLIIPPNNIDFTKNGSVKVADEKSQYAVFNGYHLLQILIQCVLDIAEDHVAGLDGKALSRYYDLLMRDKEGRLEDLVLRTRYDRVELPVFCYAALMRRDSTLSFSMTVLFRDFYFPDKRFDYLAYKDLTIFQACILFGSDEFCARLLRRLFQTHQVTRDSVLSLLSETVDCESEQRGCTMFQWAVLGGKSGFIHACINYGVDLSSLVNKPYPVENDKYAGWMPIQLAVYKVKKGSRDSSLCYVLLNIRGINLDVCYPNNIYLGGLSVLQAALLDLRYDPYKYAVTGRMFGEEGICQFVDKMSSEQINYVCQERSSRFYGMTALHIAISGQEERPVQALLNSEKTDYTVTNSFRQTPLEIAQFLRNDNLTQYVKEAIKKFPSHSERTKYCSEVCPSLEINRDRWIVSIARENDSHHAFLIVEGLEQEMKQEQMRAVVWVAQLYLPGSSNTAFGKARVDIEPEYEKLEMGRGKTKHLLPSVRNKLKPLVQLNAGTMLFYVSAYVESKECQRIVREIKEEKDKLVSYNICGRPAISTKIRSHNCVSWAMEKYNSIVPERSRLPIDWSSYIFTSAKGFLNEEFVYIADASALKDVLKDEVSRLNKDKQRLLKAQDTLCFRQNIQWGLLTFALFIILLNATEYPASGFFRGILSLFSGGIAFGIFNSKFVSPREREYTEEPQARNRLT